MAVASHPPSHLATALRLAGVSQASLADAAGVSCGYVCQIVAGRLPSEEVLTRLARALDMSPADLRTAISAQ